MGLRSLTCWDSGFESRHGHGCLSLVSVLCYQVEVSATVLSPIQRSLAECGVSECDHETSTMRMPWLTRTVELPKKITVLTILTFCLFTLSITECLRSVHMPYQRIVTITIIIILFLIIIIIIIFSMFVIIIIVILVQGVRSADKSLDTAYIPHYRRSLTGCDCSLLTSYGMELKMDPKQGTRTWIGSI